MKASLALALAVLAIFAAITDSADLADSRHNLAVGNILDGDVVLYSSRPYVAGRGTQVRMQDAVYRGTATSRVTAVRAIENGVSQGASVHILAGGVGRNNVTIRFTSARGGGFDYQVTVHGRP